MKAVIYTKYGPPDVLKLEEVGRPAPKNNEVLIRVHATTVSAPDYRIRSMKVSMLFWLPARIAYGFIRPRRTILGREVAAVGRDVESFKEGDRVFGYDSSGFGAYAEYVCRPEEGAMAIKPSNMTYEEAASVPHGALAALFFLRKGSIKSGEQILINGAAGAVGSNAVQLAKHFGAQVTGVCSAPQAEMVKSLGADKIIDYAKADFTVNGKTYDVIFDTFGNTSFSRCKSSLKQKGRYIPTVFGLLQLVQMLWTAMIGSKKVICAISPESKADLLFLKDLIEEGKIRSVIDRRYRLDETAEAHRYVESGKKKGNVVITVEHKNNT
jgi:NADPH:quinone reductase-like Zn-dependent oxidoreductase